MGRGESLSSSSEGCWLTGRARVRCPGMFSDSDSLASSASFDWGKSRGGVGRVLTGGEPTSGGVGRILTGGEPA